jgi:hypothetical protein
LKRILYVILLAVLVAWPQVGLEAQDLSLSKDKDLEKYVLSNPKEDVGKRIDSAARTTDDWWTARTDSYSRILSAYGRLVADTDALIAQTPNSEEVAAVRSHKKDQLEKLETTLKELDRRIATITRNDLRTEAEEEKQALKKTVAEVVAEIVVLDRMRDTLGDGHAVLRELKSISVTMVKYYNDQLSRCSASRRQWSDYYEALRQINPAPAAQAKAPSPSPAGQDISKVRSAIDETAPAQRDSPANRDTGSPASVRREGAELPNASPDRPSGRRFEGVWRQVDAPLSESNAIEIVIVAQGDELHGTLTRWKPADGTVAAFYGLSGSQLTDDTGLLQYSGDNGGKGGSEKGKVTISLIGDDELKVIAGSDERVLGNPERSFHRVRTGTGVPTQWQGIEDVWTFDVKKSPSANGSNPETSRLIIKNNENSRFSCTYTAAYPSLGGVPPDKRELRFDCWGSLPATFGAPAHFDWKNEEASGYGTIQRLSTNRIHLWWHTTSGLPSMPGDSLDLHRENSPQ